MAKFCRALLATATPGSQHCPAGEHEGTEGLVTTGSAAQGLKMLAMLHGKQQPLLWPVCTRQKEQSKLAQAAADYVGMT